MSRRPHLRQGLLFICVGGLATGAHTGAALAMRYGLAAPPLMANLAGYLLAVSISYLGNAALTFRARPWRLDQISRFLAVSLLGLAAGQGIVWVATSGLGLPFWAALGVVIVTVPVLTFVCSKYWVFRRAATVPPTAAPRG